MAGKDRPTPIPKTWSSTFGLPLFCLSFFVLSPFLVLSFFTFQTTHGKALRERRAPAPRSRGLARLVRACVASFLFLIFQTKHTGRGPIRWQSGGCGIAVDQRRDPEGDTPSRRHGEKQMVTSRRTKRRRH
jgi:hypothetical protein